MKYVIKSVLAAICCLSVGVAFGQQKIGHVNTPAIFQVMAEVRTANEAYQAFAKTKQTELEQMETEYRKKLTEGQELQQTRSEANKTTVDPQLQVIETTLMDLQRRMQEQQQKAQQEMQAKEDELYTPIQTKVDNAIKAVAKEKGYAYVLDVANPAVKFFETGDDLQMDVRAKLGIPADAKPITVPAPAQ